MKAIWNDKIIAESDETIVIENNHYFPRESVNDQFLVSSETHSQCPWKGRASYYTLEVDGVKNVDAAWNYDNPSDAAKEIRDYVAFWKGVNVTD